MTPVERELQLEYKRIKIANTKWAARKSRNGQDKRTKNNSINYKSTKVSCYYDTEWSPNPHNCPRG